MLSNNEFNFFGGEGTGKVPPIPGGYGNPTGVDTGLFGGGPRSGGNNKMLTPGNPQVPMYGGVNNNNSVFPGNGNLFGGPNDGIQNIQVGGNLYDSQGQYHLGKQLRDIFGESTGNLIASFLS